MWNHFDGKPYTREQFAVHLAAIPAGQLGWCKAICVHNTAGPTIAQWESKVCTPAQRILNLESYYEHSLGWHAGPHGFIPPSKDICIFGFTPFIEPGVHASCFNSSMIGLEMVGDFDSEDFNSGLGALVRDNAVYVIAMLCRKRGLRPDGYKLGVSGLHFHVDCKRDNHACPGKTVSREALVASVLAEMERQSAGAVVGSGEGGSVAGAASVALIDVPADAATVAKLETDRDQEPETKGGWFKDWSFAKVNDLAEQGSRLAQHIRDMTAGIWKRRAIGSGVGGTAATVVAQSPAATSWIAAHPFLSLALAVGGVVVAYEIWDQVQAYRIRKGLLSAAADGRYFPRGGVPQLAKGA